MPIPADPKSPVVGIGRSTNFTSYKNRNGGIWARGEMTPVQEPEAGRQRDRLHPCVRRCGLRAFTSRVVDSLFVGESDNIGNPTTPAEMAYGRSLPKPTVPDFPIRGYEYYDLPPRRGEHHLRELPAQRHARCRQRSPTCCITSFGMSTENSVEGAKFVNAKPVDFPPVRAPLGLRFRPQHAYRSAAIHDKDGSVGGVPDCLHRHRQRHRRRRAEPARSSRAGARPCARATWAASASAAISAIRRQDRSPIRSCSAATAGGTNITGETTIPSGAEVRVETARKDLSLSLREMDKGSLGHLRTARLHHRRRGHAASQPGRAARRRGPRRTSRMASTLWVKLVVEDPTPKGPVVVQVGQLRAQANIDVSKPTAVAMAARDDAGSRRQ